jgi:hypothetical protein
MAQTAPDPAELAVRRRAPHRGDKVNSNTVSESRSVPATADTLIRVESNAVFTRLAQTHE